MKTKATPMSLPMILGIALGIGLMVWSGVIVLEAWFNTRMQQEHESKVIVPPMVELQAYKAEQSSLLETYRWLDREAGVVQLPVERAMQLVVQEHSVQEHSGGGR